MRPSLLFVIAWMVALLAQSCVYDHRITQAIQERRRRAQAAEGARLRAERTALPTRNVGTVLFYVAEEYRRQHPQYRETLRDLVDAANAVIAPTFGIRLEVTGVRDWTPGCDAAQLASCLDELASVDDAQREHWVVGVLGSLPRYTTSFEDLGVALVPGRHFVLRDVSDVAERSAIDRAFATFTPSRRDEIYKKRKHHKRLAVFLHEWAHTLGALHTRESAELLHVSYDDRMERFGAVNEALIAAGLTDRFAPSAPHAKLLAALEAAPTDRIDARERDQLVLRLRAGATAPSGASPMAPEPAPAPAPTTATPTTATPTTATPSHPFLLSGPEETLLAGLSEDDRAIYREAGRTLVDGDPRRARDALAPLLTRYPDCYAVQHLGCGLAMQLGHQADTQTYCNKAQTLARTNR